MEILTQGSQTLRVLTDKPSFKKFARLQYEGVIDPRMEFFDVTAREAKAFGIDYDQMQWGRTILRDYVHGILIDLLTSRIAHAVGSAVAKKSASDSSFSHGAAAAFFLALQHQGDFSSDGLKKHPTIQYADALSTELLSKKIFFTVMPMASLARIIVGSEMEPAAVERFLEIHFKNMLRNLDSLMGQETDETRIARHFGYLDGGGPWAMRKPGSGVRETHYLWRETLQAPGEVLTSYRITRYKQQTRNPIRGPRLMVPVFNLPVEETSKFSSLVTTELFQENLPLGQTLALDAETGTEFKKLITSFRFFRP